MANLDKTIRDFAKTMQNNGKPKTTPYDTPAEVVRTEGDIVWVHIPGGVDETPVKKTIDAKKGDTVQIRVSGGTAYLIGNASSPPTDDTTANIAQNTAVNANINAVVAKKTAEEAKDSAEKMAQHFWTDGDGAHITEVTQEEYFDDPENSGGNTLIDSNGMRIRTGENDIAIFNKDSIILKTEEGADALTISVGSDIKKVPKTDQYSLWHSAQARTPVDYHGYPDINNFKRINLPVEVGDKVEIKISELHYKRTDVIGKLYTKRLTVPSYEQEYQDGPPIARVYLMEIHGVTAYLDLILHYDGELDIHTDCAGWSTYQGSLLFIFNWYLDFIKYPMIVGIPTIESAGSIIADKYKTFYGALIGSYIRISGEDGATQNCPSDYRTLNLKNVGITRGNAFEIVRIGSDTPQRWGIKCLYPGTLLVGGKVTYTSGFTANDITYTQAYNYTTGVAIGGGYRHRTTTTNASITVSVPSTPTAVSANDVIVMRGQNASGARGTVNLESSMLFAMYIGPLLNV